jgi:hypothetical protein
VTWPYNQEDQGQRSLQQFLMDASPVPGARGALPDAR